MALKHPVIRQVCEVCRKEPAISIAHNRGDDKWYYACSECLPDGYWIGFDMLEDDKWFDHMSKKQWVDMISFAPRLGYAYRQYHTNKRKRRCKKKT